jgi:hypothetical protein
MILWADDDSEGLLAQLPTLFARKGCTLLPTASFGAAVTKLEDGYNGSGASRYQGLLVDVILPRQNRGSSVARDLGVLLASRAVREFGISRVCFLTVVQASQLRARMEQVRSGVLPPPHIRHCDKATILEENWVPDVLEFFNVSAAEKA